MEILDRHFSGDRNLRNHFFMPLDGDDVLHTSWLTRSLGVEAWWIPSTLWDGSETVEHSEVLKTGNGLKGLKFMDNWILPIHGSWNAYWMLFYFVNTKLEMWLRLNIKGPLWIKDKTQRAIPDPYQNTGDPDRSISMDQPGFWATTIWALVTTEDSW